MSDQLYSVDNHEQPIEGPHVHHPWCGCNSGFTRRAILRGALLTGASLAASPLLESEARADMFMPSVEEQKKLGRQAAAQVERKYRILRDSRARDFDDVGRRLVSTLSRDARGSWDFDFNVIDHKDVNAFALPGGPMYIFTGLFDRIRTEDELAGVTGHEIAHIYEQHWARQYAASQKRRLGIAVLLGLTRADRSFGQIAGLADQLVTLRFSRKEEDQADERALTNMTAADYNPEGLVDLFQTLQKAGGSRGTSLAFLQSHPVTSRRIDYARQRIGRLPERDFGPKEPLRSSAAGSNYSRSYGGRYRDDEHYDDRR
jgi:beta-barrel assembly-enhancing protease